MSKSCAGAKNPELLLVVRLLAAKDHYLSHHPEGTKLKTARNFGAWTWATAHREQCKCGRVRFAMLAKNERGPLLEYFMQSVSDPDSVSEECRSRHRFEIESKAKVIPSKLTMCSLASGSWPQFKKPVLSRTKVGSIDNRPTFWGFLVSLLWGGWIFPKGAVFFNDDFMHLFLFGVDLNLGEKHGISSQVGLVPISCTPKEKWSNRYHHLLKKI